MAQVDATGLSFTFDAFDLNNVDHDAFVGTTPFSYHWTSNNSYNITALGYLGNITAGLAGTVSAVNILDSGFNPGLSITGLNNIPLIDLVDTGDPNNHQRKFWDTLLDGDTEILMPTNSGSLSIMGDFVRVGTGQTRYGGDDTFIGTQPAPNSGTTTGDAIRVEAGGTLYGGVDRFENTTAYNLIGDVGDATLSNMNNLGTTYGGDDIFTLTDTAQLSPVRSLSYLIGDVDYTGFGGTLHGGDDTARVTNFSNASYILGDAYLVEGETFGGDDTLIMETTIPGRLFGNGSYMSGDAYQINPGSGVFTFTGGDDKLTANNSDMSYLLGDFYTSTYANVTGGNDMITAAGTFPEPGPINNYTVTPSIGGGIYGDGETFNGSGSEFFTGGDDMITTSNASLGSVSGDLSSFFSDGMFRGGDDHINIHLDRSTYSFTSTVYGDASTISQSGDVITGHDIIELDLLGSASTTFTVYGDVSSYTPTSAATAIFGNDSIRADTAGNQNAFIYGDGNSATSSLDMDLTYGHDTLIGGGGNDSIVGDFLSVSAGMATLMEAGGNDILDGRGGNDTLDGGYGSDTAAFSLNQSVFVALDGIPGSGMNPFHAIGQGNDRLISIENVIGSSQNDVIIGNMSNNVIEGAGGSDNLIGNGGIDTLSYASSGGFVNVSLATGYAGGGSGSHAVGDTFLNGGGTSSFYHVIGSDYDDLLNGDANANHLMGGLGNDNLRGRGAGDTLDGGEGEDWIDYSDSPANINVSLQTGFANGGVGTHALGDTFIDIENVRGTVGGDRITGNAEDNVFEGRAGNDSLFGGAGSDTADYASSGSFVNVSLLTGFTGGGGGNHALGDTFDSIENLRGSAHADVLNGSNSDNILRGRAGADALNGNGGSDTADYTGSSAFVNVSLLTGFTGGGGGNHASGDTFSSIENLIGSSHNDILNGSNSDNMLEGAAGGDVLRGNGGNDTASYGSSNEGVTVSLATGFTLGGHAVGDSFDSIENVYGSDHDDFLSGDGNDNILSGGEGNDTLRGRVGADELNGGADNDTADYGDASGGINVSLNTGYTAGAHAVGDTFVSIENLTGSSHNDTLSGDGAANILNGLAGNDSLTGLGGADVFAFATGFGDDTINDFQNGSDMLDMTAHTQISGIADLIITNSGADALVNDAFGNSILLLGEANNISGDDFIF